MTKEQPSFLKTYVTRGIVTRWIWCKTHHHNPKGGINMEKFGSVNYFENYLKGQIAREGKGQEVVHRVHFSMTNFIFETYNAKDAMGMLKNLNVACESISKTLATRGGLKV
jgi:hypothetical protein